MQLNLKDKQHFEYYVDKVTGNRKALKWKKKLHSDKILLLYFSYLVSFETVT